MLKVIQGSYDVQWVSMSVIVAIVLSFVFLQLVNSTRNCPESQRNVRAAGGAAAFGFGIWLMHFTGMFAFQIPISVDYSPFITLLSLLFGIAVSVVVMMVVVRPYLSLEHWLASGIVAGLCISSIHYIGMMAMQTPAVMRYDPVIVVLSVLIGISAAQAALVIVFQVATSVTMLQTVKNAAGALLLGFAIAGMHYTGMAATHYILPGEVDAAAAVGIGAGPVALYSAGISVLVTIALILSLRRSGKIKENEHNNASDNVHYSYVIICVVIIAGLIIFSQWWLEKSNFRESLMLDFSHQMHERVLLTEIYEKENLNEIDVKQFSLYGEDIDNLMIKVNAMLYGGVIDKIIIDPVKPPSTRDHLREFIDIIEGQDKEFSVARVKQLGTMISDEIKQHIIREKKIDRYLNYAVLLLLISLMYGLYLGFRRHQKVIARKNLILNKVLKKLEFQKQALDEHAIVSITDTNGKITYVNDRFCQISQYGVEDLIGKNHNIVNSSYHPAEFFEKMWKTISRGGVWHGIIRNHKKDGSFYWVDTTIVPLLDDNNRPAQYIAVRTDITARIEFEKRLEILNEELEKNIHKKVCELKKAQEYLMQSEKMASIGQLAAGVAHEINNPVGYINSNICTLKNYVENLLRLLHAYEGVESSLTLEDIKNIHALKENIDLEFLKEDTVHLVIESIEGVDRIKRIIKDMKDFSHIDEGEWQWTDINQGIESTLNIVYNELKYKAVVIKEYGDLPEIECIASQISQVFMNLLVNAAHAIDEHGTITIRSDTDGNDWVWVQISDTGKGIPGDKINRIFEPFYTTKPVGKGTGLGLSISYGIAQKHGGRIDVDSEPGKGSTFTVWLPVKRVEERVEMS